MSDRTADFDPSDDSLISASLSWGAPALLALMILMGQVYMLAANNFAAILQTRFLPYCLLGTFAIHMWTRPSRAEVIWTSALAGVFALSFIVFTHQFQADWPSLVACGSFLGLASLFVLAVRVFCLRGARQRDTCNTLIAGSIFGYSAVAIGFVLKLTATLQPRTYDLYLYAADMGFGWPLCAWVGHFVRDQLVLSKICGVGYECLPLLISLLLAYERSGRQALPIRVLPAFLGGGVAVYVLYNVLPAAGPTFAFESAFPDHLPALASLAIQPIHLANAPRNAVPSMHLACAVLIYWSCRRLPLWVRIGSALYIVFTLLATIGFGEHYVVDLVAALPYALSVQAACAPRALRERPAVWWTFATGAGLCIAWIAALRFAVALFHSVAFTWLASVTTIAVCWVAQRRFVHAERPGAKPARSGVVQPDFVGAA